MAKRLIRVGDSFERNTFPKTTWVVERVFEYDDLPIHARLVEHGSRRVITVASSVLNDGREFKLVAQGADPANV